jgi:hypothetical protein
MKYTIHQTPNGLFVPSLGGQYLEWPLGRLTDNPANAHKCITLDEAHALLVRSNESNPSSWTLIEEGEK